ncbi:hypothetical protein BKA62DRAFT_681779 [Auriculariales sp. MPI-PUGE-AT-0066]|nr:hypothetical protein BKA62DRAFT_681779 [Auriculariales sp. MPI-PUGE-AT-0066]
MHVVITILLIRRGSCSLGRDILQLRAQLAMRVTCGALLTACSHRTGTADSSPYSSPCVASITCGGKGITHHTSHLTVIMFMSRRLGVLLCGLELRFVLQRQTHTSVTDWHALVSHVQGVQASTESR